MVYIPLPASGTCFASEAVAPQLPVPGLFHWPLLGVLKAALQETVAEHFHLFPFQEYWQPDPEIPVEHLYSKLYSSDVFTQEYERIHSQPHEPGCGLKTVIIGFMLWSDSMHLTSFGKASLWPIYLFIGNLSKYTHAKPTSFAAHHLTYIPKVCTLSLVHVVIDSQILASEYILGFLPSMLW